MPPAPRTQDQVEALLEQTHPNKEPMAANQISMEDTTKEDRARHWEHLAKKLRAAAAECDGAASLERKAPYATGSFHEIATALREEIRGCAQEIWAIMQARKEALRRAYREDMP